MTKSLHLVSKKYREQFFNCEVIKDTQLHYCCKLIYSYLKNVFILLLLMFIYY